MSDLTPEIVAQGRQLLQRWNDTKEKDWPTHGIIKGVALHFLRHGDAYADAFDLLNADLEGVELVTSAEGWTAWSRFNEYECETLAEALRAVAGDQP